MTQTISALKWSMPKIERAWSNFQLSIFDNVRSGQGHTVVNALAGSGKTTALIEAIKHIPKKNKILMIAFNRNIAAELRERAPSYIDVFTSHSFGLSTIRKRLSKDAAVDPNKTLNLTRLYLQSKKIKTTEALVFSLTRAISLCKSYLIDTPSKIDVLLDQFSIDIINVDRKEFIKIICAILRQCKETAKKVLDFDDLLYIPFVYNLQPDKWTRILVDEIQDFAISQTELILKAIEPGGRVLAVGDANQSLYSWRGADADSMSKLTTTLNAKVLTLPISYRCAKSIIKLAQEIVPDIQTAPNAKEGLVKTISEKDMYDKVAAGDFIISRTNAPLIKIALKLLNEGRPANILGRDISLSLKWIINQSEKTNVKDFLVWLVAYKEKEIARLKENNRKPQVFIDKIACLENLCEGAKTIDQVKDNLSDLFKQDEKDNQEHIICLTTVHRSKGLERKRVFLIEKSFTMEPSQEELNVRYVSITRAKEELYLVE